MTAGYARVMSRRSPRYDDAEVRTLPGGAVPPELLRRIREVWVARDAVGSARSSSAEATSPRRIQTSVTWMNENVSQVSIPKAKRTMGSTA
jgi:hypothetical protein